MATNWESEPKANERKKRRERENREIDTFVDHLTKRKGRENLRFSSFSEKSWMNLTKVAERNAGASFVEKLLYFIGSGLM